MSREAERKLAASKKRLTEKIDEIKIYVKGNVIKINYAKQTS